MVSSLHRSRTRLLILLLRRLGLGILTAFAAVTLTFFLLRLIGTDPVDSLLAQGLTRVEQADALRHRLGLDRPLILQYAAYLAELLQGDLGSSLYTQRPVLLTIQEQFRWTVELGTLGLLIGVASGLILGVCAAWWQEHLAGSLARLLASLLTSFPVAFIGILALLLAGRSALPSAGLLLPGLVLGLTTSGPIARLVYAKLKESLDSPYILAALARGIRRNFRLLWHALRPILPPLFSLIALEAAFLFAGTVVTETVFSRPGLGRLMVRSILDGDYPITQGLVVLAALFYTASHVLADWLSIVFDPRVRDLQ